MKEILINQEQQQINQWGYNPMQLILLQFLCIFRPLNSKQIDIEGPTESVCNKKNENHT